MNELLRLAAIQCCEAELPFKRTVVGHRCSVLVAGSLFRADVHLASKWFNSVELSHAADL